MYLRFLVAGALLAGCSEYEFQSHQAADAPQDPDEAQGPAGGIEGRICAPNGNTYVPGAHVWVETDSGPVTTETDADGWFLLEGVDPGDHTVFVEKGSFSLEIDVEVIADQVTELAQDECFSADDIEIGVVSGIYDEIEEIIDRLGFDFDLIDGSSSAAVNGLLSTPADLEKYDIIFFNCGMDMSWEFSNASTVTQNIRDYVSAGGSVYISDQAYYLADASYPEMATFQGFGLSSQDAFVGQAETVDAQVLDSGLVTALGANQALIDFNMGGWAAMEEIDQGQALLRGTYTYFDMTDPFSFDDMSHEGPLAVRYFDGQGQVLYTSFHNNAQTTMDMDVILEEIILSL